MHFNSSLTWAFEDVDRMIMLPIDLDKSDKVTTDERARTQNLAAYPVQK